MWVNRVLFDTILADNKAMQEQVLFERTGASRMSATATALREQKAKDDMTIDWMRHRINALEKERVILLQRAAGIILPTPEIVPSAPKTVAPGSLSMNDLPSFEDVGDAEALRLGLKHDEGGNLEYVDRKAE